MARPDLPTGTVTFLFSDIEGSTRLLDELGSELYAQALADHRQVMREAFSRHGGSEVDTQGDAFFAAFPRADGAVAAAGEIQHALAEGPIRVRIGIHTGTPLLGGESYVGPDVHRAARIAAVGHGGQVLISATTRSLVSAKVMDLGDHRLKDLSAAERIYQLGNQPFPPLNSLQRTNMPVPATPFVGRERELEELVEMLAETRLLTLTGPGGTGKTRLALQAAGAAADRFPDGVFWVALAALRDPELMLEEIARALRAQDGLAAHVGDKAVLILLDNFEQVVGAADELARLIGGCPNMRVLVTSREILRVSGEQAYPVQPLEPQDGRDLFMARARAVDPAFLPSASVDELCARLDNLPLALELAAARVRVLSPVQLMERLGGRLDLLKAGRGVDPRQQTLRAAIEWSYDLLNDDERDLFAALSVFRGGWTLLAAETICQAALDVLESLVDKSLVRHIAARFSMLETIREYAAERAADPGIRGRHAEFFLDLAEQTAPHLLRGDPKPWLDGLEAEHDNIRAALDYFSETGQGELEQRLAGSLWRFWQRRGHFVEGRRRLERALRADERPTPARAWALFGTAVLVGESRDETATSTSLFGQALALFDDLGDAHAAARVRMNLGVMATVEADFSRAERLLHEAVRTFEELGDDNYVAVTTDHLASAYEEQGNLERARELHEEAVRRAHAAGNVHLEAEALGSVGELALLDGQMELALSMLKRSTALFRELGDPTFVASNLSRFARALVLADRFETAAQVLARAEATFDELGIQWFRKFNPVTRAMIRDQLDDDSYDLACGRGRALTPEAALALALNELS